MIPASSSALRRLWRERREPRRWWCCGGGWPKMGPEDEQLESRGADRVTTGVGVAIGN